MSWKTIIELLNKMSKFSNIDCLKDSQNTFLNNKTISNAMNHFLCTIVYRLASKMDAVLNPLLPGQATETNNCVKFQFNSITVKDIRDVIAKIKTTKGFGKYNVCCNFLKLAMPFIEKSLAALFNTSSETSQSLNLWKCSRCTPIF